MPSNESTSLRLQLIWSRRRKQWDCLVTGGDGRRAWTAQGAIDTTAELDQAAAWLIIQAVREEMESWLTYGPEYS